MKYTLLTAIWFLISLSVGCALVPLAREKSEPVIMEDRSQIYKFHLKDYGPPWRISLHAKAGEENRVITAYLRNTSAIGLFIGAAKYRGQGGGPLASGKEILCYEGKISDFPNEDFRVNQSVGSKRIGFELRIVSKEPIDGLAVTATNQRIHYD